MERGIKITPSNCSSFNNGLHTQFHLQMYNLINAWSGGLSLINVKADLMNEWKSMIDIETDINREVVASVDTARLLKLDKERDDLTTYLFSAVRSARRSPVQSVQEAAERLYLLVKKYSGLQAESYDLQTMHTDGLLHDLGKDANAADLATLGQSAVVSQLQQVNTDYRALRTQRTATRADSKLPSARETRQQSDAIYARICQLIEVSYLLTTTASGKESIEQLWNKMNQQIAEIKTAHKQSTGRGSGGSTTKPSTGGSTTPAQDKADGE